MNVEDDEHLRQLTKRLEDLSHVFVDLQLPQERVWSERIIRMVDEDVEARCPNHAEEIIDSIVRLDSVLADEISQLERIVRLGKEADHGMGETQKVICDIEDKRKTFQNLRLDITNWVRQFEGIPDGAEALQQLLSLPTSEEVEAETAEAYRTHGANLLPKRPADGKTIPRGRRGQALVTPGTSRGKRNMTLSGERHPDEAAGWQRTTSLL